MNFHEIGTFHIWCIYVWTYIIVYVHICICFIWTYMTITSMHLYGFHIHPPLYLGYMQHICAYKSQYMNFHEIGTFHIWCIYVWTYIIVYVHICICFIWTYMTITSMHLYGFHIHPPLYLGYMQHICAYKSQYMNFHEIGTFHIWCIYVWTYIIVYVHICICIIQTYMIINHMSIYMLTLYGHIWLSNINLYMNNNYTYISVLFAYGHIQLLTVCTVYVLHILYIHPYIQDICAYMHSFTSKSPSGSSVGRGPPRRKQFPARGKSGFTH